MRSEKREAQISQETHKTAFEGQNINFSELHLLNSYIQDRERMGAKEGVLANEDHRSSLRETYLFRKVTSLLVRSIETWRCFVASRKFSKLQYFLFLVGPYAFQKMASTQRI